MRMVFGFAEINLSDLPRVGGKNASLGEMISKLSVLGVKVPDGFATSVDAYKTFMKENNLEDKINLVLKDIRVNDIPALKKSSRKIKNFIMAAPFSKKFEAEIRRAYQQLHSSLDHPVAVRSSATVEDLPEASFAGLQESYLNIVGVDAILKAIKQVYASLFTERAIAYRVHQKIDHANAGISVGIQKMVRGDLASSGVIFTLDTESGFDQVIFITASYGLGECIVQGAVNPDEFYVHKPTLNVGKKSIISRKLGSKKIKMVYAGSGNQGLQTIKVDNEDQQRFCLTDEGIIQLSKLAEGIATISAAFYPKPVIVRFSDFKSNEYASLLGGKIFEPQEENPMIGYRGASRYISGAFQACFDLECEAIKRVREKKGLINTQVMFPFVRTPEELQQLLILLKQNGLERGKEELQVYMMCEVPSNAILAEEFLQHVDGYSIGSNDLTQLMLGLDRDSELVAHLFDERNAAVKAVLRHAIGTAKKLGKYIGICGQGPSDHIDFAKWLMEEGVDTLSLSPDSVVRTWLALGKLEKM